LTAAAASCSRTDIVLRWGMEIVGGDNYIAPGHHRTLDQKKYYMAYTESKNNQEEKDYEI
jgi:hypothetical protein